nr:MAG TPA: hypothetical protein [Caudoviricetes sp.]
MGNFLKNFPCILFLDCYMNKFFYYFIPQEIQKALPK